MNTLTVLEIFASTLIVTLIVTGGVAIFKMLYSKQEDVDFIHSYDIYIKGLDYSDEIIDEDE
jgi:predicted permease